MAFRADGHFSCSERAGNAAAFDATIQFRRRQFGEQKILFWFYVTYPYGNCFRTVPYLSLSRRNAPFHFWMILRYLRHCVILLPPLFFCCLGWACDSDEQTAFIHMQIFLLCQKKKLTRIFNMILFKDETSFPSHFLQKIQLSHFAYQFPSVRREAIFESQPRCEISVRICNSMDVSIHSIPWNVKCPVALLSCHYCYVCILLLPWMQHALDASRCFKLFQQRALADGVGQLKT